MNGKCTGVEVRSTWPLRSCGEPKACFHNGSWRLLVFTFLCVVRASFGAMKDAAGQSPGETLYQGSVDFSAKGRRVDILGIVGRSLLPIVDYSTLPFQCESHQAPFMRKEHSGASIKLHVWALKCESYVFFAQSFDLVGRRGNYFKVLGVVLGPRAARNQAAS